MAYIDRLLEKIEDAEARLQFKAIADKHPEVSRWVMDPDSAAAAATRVQWVSENWDTEHGMTQAEYAQAQRIQDLEAQVAQGEHSKMTLDELNQHLGTFMSEKKLITSDTFANEIGAREKLFGDQLNAMARVATRVPYLNQKHQQEFNEFFDPDAFLEGANKAGATSLDEYYNSFTADKREAKRQADVQSQIEAAEKRGRDKAISERLQNENSSMPTLDGSPEMGHFEARIRRGNTPLEGQSNVPKDAELGRGQIARAAALAGDQADLGRIN